MHFPNDDLCAIFFLQCRRVVANIDLLVVFWVELWRFFSHSCRWCWAGNTQSLSIFFCFVSCLSQSCRSRHKLLKLCTIIRVLTTTQKKSRTFHLDMVLYSYPSMTQPCSTSTSSLVDGELVFCCCRRLFWHERYVYIENGIPCSKWCFMKKNVMSEVETSFKHSNFCWK